MNVSGEFIQTLHTWLEVSMRRSMHAFARWMNDCGLTRSQIGALMRLYYHGDCPISEIGDDLGISTAAASQLVDRLVQMDLLERVEDPHDRRVKKVYLSDAGIALISHGVEARTEWVDDLAKIVNQADQALVVSGLQSLILATGQMEKEMV
jgi:DNA-binding MarR family transcriptional regulator